MGKFIVEIIKFIIIYFLVRWVLSDVLDGKMLNAVSIIIAFIIDGINSINASLTKINNELRESNGKLPEE